MADKEKRYDKLFWIDMEMTGLDPAVHRILEVAAVVTDWELRTLEEYHRVVRQPREILAAMDEWCAKTHGESGLTKEVAGGVALAEAENALISLAAKHFSGEKIVLCGNSVYFDRKFIDAQMPKFAALLHYRILDVTSFKEVFRNKYGVEVEKKDRHRARDDIFESIAELRHYLGVVGTGRGAFGGCSSADPETGPA